MYEEIFGSKTRPYYIWAPRWTESSAGARCMHYLCHSLNQAGQKAFLVLQDPAKRGQTRLNPMLQTPILTKEVFNLHKTAKSNPIVVYPEDVFGNPLNAETEVRILWMYAGAMGGPNTFPQALVYAFSENIALDYEEKSGRRPKVIFVPHIDPREFEFTTKKKNYQVVYAGKYRSYVGEPPEVGNLPSVEIMRTGPKMQSRDEVKKLLREASVVYSFDNSAIVTEAILSGTPASYISNDFLGKIIVEKELGWNGTAIGEDRESLFRASQTVKAGRQQYLEVIETYKSRLDNFIEDTQNYGKTRSQSKTLLFLSRSVVLRNRLILALSLLYRRGFRVFFGELIRFVRANLKS